MEQILKNKREAAGSASTPNLTGIPVQKRRKPDNDDRWNTVQLHYHSDASAPVVQMYKIYCKPYYEANRNRPDETSTTVRANMVNAWKNQIDTGINLAIEWLTYARDACTDETVAEYIGGCLNVLCDDNLCIFPIRGQCGASGYGVPDISIQYKMPAEGGLSSNEVTAKTLIHEAFHIIGGCWEKQEDGSYIARNDETNCRETDMDKLLTSIRSKDKMDINADTFAQYVVRLNGRP